MFELIQNADDNKYECESPTLSFTYKRGSLRVDCNEVGFTESNVRAIRDIGKSTKAGLRRSTRHIGEKGIGFKSVFKVAKVIYISSRDFTFKLDRSQGSIGLVAPTWADFPKSTIPGCTSFYLQLSESCDEAKIIEDFQILSPQVLMFTRKLRKIEIRVEQGAQKVWSEVLWRSDIHENGSTIRLLHRGSTTSRYVVTTHSVPQLPKEEKRPGC